MAMGDSITAGFSARSDIYESRDISWSIGKGEAKQMTFPWLVEQYSPKVEGQSTKKVLPKDVLRLPKGDYHPETDHLNVAESSGAVHSGSLVEQWGYLEKALEKYTNLDGRWKVLTIFMLANDVCYQCSLPMYTGAWRAAYDALLAKVVSKLTKTYVNLVPMLQLSDIHRIQQGRIGCKIEHTIIDEAGCIDNGTPAQLAMMDANTRALNNQLHEMAVSWQAKLKQDGRTDMYIGTQPFLEGIGKTLDHTFISKLDCFHPSAMAHQELAIALWDSMLVHDRKNLHKYIQVPGPKLICPTKDSVFYTGPDVVPNPPADPAYNVTDIVV